MIQAFTRSLAQLTDRTILLILLKVILLTILLFILFGIAAYFGLVWLFAWLGWTDGVDAVERRYYPERAETAKPPSYALGIKMGLASTGRALSYNILAAPLYIVLLVTGIGIPIAFFAVNGILLGRDLQDMVAARHVTDYRNLEAEWRLPKIQRFGLGLIAALLLAVPFVNFLAPVLGAAMATHLVHGKKEEKRP